MSTSSAFQAGYFFGAAIVLLFLVAVYVGVVFVLVQAFTRRTKGWIVLGSLGAIFMLASCIGIGSAMYKGFVTGFNRARARKLGREISTTTTPETIHGKALAYTLDLPEGWTRITGPADFDLVAHQGELYVGVIAEGASLGNAETIAKIARGRLGTKVSNVVLGDTSPEKIDGRNWLQFTAEGQIEKIQIKYQFHVYSGDEGTFQVVGWTLPTRYDRSAELLNKLAHSFHFPPVTAPLPGAASASAQRQTVAGDKMAYHLTVPADWQVKRPGSSLDLVATNPSVSLAVAANALPGTSKGQVGTVQASLEKAVQNAHFGEAKEVTIDGHQWQEFDVHCEVEHVSFVYDYFVYGGPEGRFHLLGWTVDSLYDQKLPIIREAAQSFRFPVGNPPASEAAPEEAAAPDTAGPSTPSPAASTPPPAGPTPSSAHKGNGGKKHR